VTPPLLTGRAVSQEACRDFARSSKLEWLETNGTGAFAMGTVAGVNTRRYHALLVASLVPPSGRRVLLARVEEEAIVDGRSFALAACQYPGIVTPRGFELLEEFQPEPCATWVYSLGGTRIEKQVYLVEGKQAVVIRYRADRALTLRVRPFLADRDYHSLQHAGNWTHSALQFHCGAQMIEDAHWYSNVEYLEELDRGFDFREDLYSPGVFVLDLKPGEWVPIYGAADSTSQGGEPPVRRDPFVVRRADGSPTIIAGYPWFTDWGRDTMISLPGLLIAPGRIDEARRIIEGFLDRRDRGIIPNRFPEAGEAPEYNTADATLWMFQAMRAWLQAAPAAGGDRAFLGDVFYPAAKDILDWHRRGTWYGIGVDPSDHLLRAGGRAGACAGAEDTQVTWMDARADGRAATPRHGKPVEINALWHGALCLMADWGDEVGSSNACRAEALAVRESFRRKFWDHGRQCLYDVLAEDGPVSKLRPNQIFAVSLGNDLLEPSQQQAVVRIVERELLTPVGLRTLDRGDPEYQPRYRGGPAERDGAYHQGTVWPWLMGPFVDAYLCAFGKTPETLAYCRRLVEQLEDAAALGPCLGSVPEIYDAEEPHIARGCPAQAWSVAELARLKAMLKEMPRGML
jgi:glycogen debranching enzyme